MRKLGDTMTWRGWSVGRTHRSEDFEHETEEAKEDELVQHGLECMHEPFRATSFDSMPNTHEHFLNRQRHEDEDDKDGHNLVGGRLQVTQIVVRRHPIFARHCDARACVAGVTQVQRRCAGPRPPMLASSWLSVI